MFVTACAPRQVNSPISESGESNLVMKPPLSKGGLEGLSICSKQKQDKKNLVLFVFESRNRDLNSGPLHYE